MDPATFNAVEPLLDQIADVVEQHLATPELHRLLSELSKVVGEGKSANLLFTVDLCDDKRQQAVPLLTTGLSAFMGKEPFRTWGDSSPQRYVIPDGIEVVPNDRCLICWGGWDFKFQNPTCKDCGARLGKECKVLLDTDQCPWCEKGTMSMAQPKCDQCGFVVDPRLAVWG